MKLSGFIPFALLASFGVAQDDLTSSLPSCIRNCVSAAIEDACGSTTDFKCACTDVQAIKGAVRQDRNLPACQSAAATCTTDDLQNFFNTFVDECQAHVGKGNGNDASSFTMMHPIVGAAAGVGALALPFMLA